MEQKKETKGQIERKIRNAIVFVPKDRDTVSVFFDDKMLRLTVTMDSAVIETGYHRHVYNAYTSSGVSRPYIYTKRMIEIAQENDCKTDSGYSYAKLLETLKAKENQAEYNIAVFFDWWLWGIFNNLYSIGETEVESFLVYEEYVHIIARNAILLSEKTEGMTNKQFLDKVIENIRTYTDNIEERVLFEKKTDEQVAAENIEAAMEHENDEILKENAGK